MITVTNMTSAGEDFFDNQYYVYCRRFLGIVGLWPYEEKSKRSRRTYFTIVILTLAIGGQIYAFVMARLKIKQSMDLMQIFLPSLLYSGNYIQILLRANQLKGVLNNIKKDWGKTMNEEQVMVMKKYSNESKIFSFMIACLFYVHAAIFFFPSVLCFFLFICGKKDKSQLILPIYAETFVESEVRYFVVLPSQIVIAFMMTTIGIAFFTMFITIIQHECLLFNILTIKIEQQFRKDTSKLDQISSDTKLEDEFEWIISIIKYHDEIINFHDLVQTLLCGATYMTQVIAAVLFVIVDFFYIFEILDKTVTIAEAMRNSIFIGGNVFMIYAAFFTGQRLIDHSISVYNKCCTVPFYELSRSTNKLLLQLTMRCMKPCNISFEGMLVASHELFTAVMKTSLSYATVFYNTR